MARERPSACRQDACTRCLPADVAADYDVAIILIHAFVLRASAWLRAFNPKWTWTLKLTYVNNSSTTWPPLKYIQKRQ